MSQKKKIPKIIKLMKYTIMYKCVLSVSEYVKKYINAIFTVPFNNFFTKRYIKATSF